MEIEFQMLLIYSNAIFCAEKKLEEIDVDKLLAIDFKINLVKCFCIFQLQSNAVFGASTAF